MWYGDTLCKRYERPAPNQFKVLTTFEDNRWSDQCDITLSKGKLANTIKDLQKGLRNSPITFERDGTAKGVIWRPRRHP